MRRLDSATIDHVYPRTLGGRAEWLNEVAACRACNSAKADRVPGFMELWRLAWLKGALLAPLTENTSAMVAEVIHAIAAVKQKEAD